MYQKTQIMMLFIVAILSITNQAQAAEGDASIFINHVETLIAKKGWVPRKDYNALVSMLIKSPSLIHAQNKEGVTAIDLAREHSDKCLERILALHEYDMDIVRKVYSGDSDDRDALSSALLMAISCNSYEAADFLIKNGAHVNTSDGLKDYPLSMAVREGDERIVQLLIERGADVNSHSGPNLEAPLHYVAFKGCENIARLLLENGADVNVEDAIGITPLWWAADREHASLAQLLIEYGADGRYGIWSANDEKKGGVVNRVV